MQLVGFSALLGEPDIDEKTRKSYIEVIMQSSNHLLSIITDIVDISNIEANLIKTYKNEMSVNAAVNRFAISTCQKQSKRILTWLMRTAYPNPTH